MKTIFKETVFVSITSLLFLVTLIEVASGQDCKWPNTLVILADDLGSEYESN